MSNLPDPAQDSSWACSHLRLQPRAATLDDMDIEPMDLSKIDDDPISYFLTPAPLLDPYGQDGDSHAMDFEMDFDAGIEDYKHPSPIIRSVSPSSLEGLSLHPGPAHRPPTPPKSPGTPDSDLPLTPDDHEDYMYWAGEAKGRSLTFPPFRLADLTGTKHKRNRALSGGGSNGPPGAFLSPQSSGLSGGVGISGSTTRGRSMTLRRAARTRQARRSPHAWREPSPDVYSIEEETDDAIDSEIGGYVDDNSTAQIGQGETARVTRARNIEIPAAKPKKRVRFILPARD